MGSAPSQIRIGAWEVAPRRLRGSARLYYLIRRRCFRYEDPGAVYLLLQFIMLGDIFSQLGKDLVAAGFTVGKFERVRTDRIDEDWWLCPAQISHVMSAKVIAVRCLVDL